MLAWILENTLVAGALAAVVALSCRALSQRPATCHVLWLAVLVCLIAPPLPIPGWPSHEIRPTGWFPPELLEVARTGTQAPVLDDSVPSESSRIGSSSLTGAAVTAGPASVPASHGNVASAPAAASAPVWWLSLHSLPRTLLILWLVGSALVLTVLALRVRRFHRFVLGGGSASWSLQRTVREVASRYGVAVPRIVVLRGLRSPMIWSLGRPRLLWPADLSNPADHSTPGGTRSVVAHELAHLRRRDHWVAWLEMAGMVLCWWNPLFWAVRRRIRDHSELACDAWALWASPLARTDYARTLIDALARESSDPVIAPGLGMSVTEGRSFRRRLRLIMSEPLSRRISPVVGLAAILVTAAVLPGWSTEPGELGEPDDVAALDPRHEIVADVARLNMHGQRYWAAKEWQEAATTYRRLAELDPDDGRACQRLARALLELGDRAGAIEAFTEQVRRGHEIPQAQLDLARAHIRNGDFDPAVTAVEGALRAGYCRVETLEDDERLSALRGDPRFDELLGLCRENRSLMRQGDRGYGRDWVVSAAAYQLASEAMPQSGLALHRLAVSRLSTGEYSQALDALERQVATGFKPAAAFYNIACAHALSGDRDAAFPPLEKALRVGFDDEKLLATDDDLDSLRDTPRFDEIVGHAPARKSLEKDIHKILRSGKTDQAVAMLEEFLDGGLGDPRTRGWAWGKLGHLCLDAGRYDQALACFGRQLELGRDVPRSLRDLACGHARRGETALAFLYLRHAIDTGYTDAWGIREEEHLATLVDDPRFRQLVQGAVDASVLSKFDAVSWDHLHDRAQDRLARNPNEGRAHYALGWARLRLQDLRGAIAAFQDQERLDYAPVIARYNIACCYATLDDKESAFQWLQRAVDTGMGDAGQLRNDPDLENLRDDPRFEKLAQEIENRYALEPRERNEEKKAGRAVF